MTTTLTTPSQALVLTPPAALTVKEAPALETVLASANLSEEITAPIQAKALEFVTGMDVMDLSSSDFQNKIAEVEYLGASELEKSHSHSNRMLETSMRSMKKTQQGSTVSVGLVQLRHQVEDLDPSKSSALNGFLADLPVIGKFRNKYRGFFHQYQSAQTQLDRIITSLENGRTELERDNADIRVERDNLAVKKATLQQYIYFADQVYSAVDTKIAEIRERDVDRANQLSRDILHPLGQRRMDLVTQLTVAEQSDLAMDIVWRSNKELIKGVERATTVTLDALRTAIMISEALAGQKLVLNQIKALTDTTNSLIAANAKALRQQSGEIYAGAASSGVDILVLENAWKELFATIREIDEYKDKAIVTMDANVKVLAGQLEEAKPYIKRAASEPEMKELVIG